MSNWEEKLNNQQLRAVTHSGSPLLVLAGAGSGKTRVLTHRTARLIKEEGVEPERILLLTFTNKAADEMKKRVKKLVGRTPGFAGTFHSFCAGLLRRYGKVVGLDPDFVIYDQTDKRQALKMVMKELDIDSKVVKVRSVSAQISNAKNEMLSCESYWDLARGGYQERVAKIWRDYQKRLKDYQAVDFDDLLLYGVGLLGNERVKQQLHDRYRYVLVDEYQDTNKAQYELTKLLVEGNEEGLTVVGDFSQSIYSWRGADYRNLEHLNRDFNNLETVELKQNYRSTQNILDAAYGVIENNNTHPILQLEATKNEGKKIKLYKGKDEKSEARFILDQIRKGDSYKDFAILYRTNAQSRALEERFIKSGTPYVLVGGTKFYERREIKDILAYLKVIANSKDKVSWERLDKVGKRRRQAFEEWLSQLKSKKELSKVSSEEFMAGVLSSTDYLSLYDEEDENDLMRLENIKELASVAREFSDLRAFLENVALVQSEAQSDLEDSDKVTLMTMHAAKGLEFKNVFVVGMEEGLFPHSRSLGEKQELEEERRLCYVAFTRAEQNLFLTYTKSRLYFGRRTSNSPSRFLTETPQHLIESVNKKGGRKIIGADYSEEAPKVDDDKLQRAVAEDFEEIDNW